MHTPPIMNWKRLQVLEKICINGPKQFKTLLFMGQLYLIIKSWVDEQYFHRTILILLILCFSSVDFA